MKRLLLHKGFLLTGTAVCFFCQTALADVSNPGGNAEKANLLDTVIAVGIILFILSVMVEKITQLVRSYGPNSWASRFFALFGIRKTWANIGKGKQHESEETKRKAEREIAMVSLVFGFLMAMAFRADLFTMITSSDPQSEILWQDHGWPKDWEWLTLPLSFLATGFFLSFGSKFFHDLIDTLLQIKNLKRKMVDENTYQAETIEEFDQYLAQSYTEIIEKAIDQNADKLKHNDATSPPMHGRMWQNGRLTDCIDLHVSGNDRGNVPEFVLVDLGKGKKARVPVQIVFGVSIPNAYTEQGDAVHNADVSLEKSGTICCKLRIGDVERLLTCSHVMTGGTSYNRAGKVSPVIKAETNGLSLGNFVWARRDDHFDIALIDPEDDAFDYKIIPGEPRYVTSSDIQLTKVRIVGRNGKEKRGLIVNNRSLKPIPIDYSDETIKLKGLIVISKTLNPNNPDPSIEVPLPGDSGGCVYDGNNRPIGMIVAGNEQFAYAIPICDILSELSATIV